MAMSCRNQRAREPAHFRWPGPILINSMWSAGPTQSLTGYPPEAAAAAAATTSRNSFRVATFDYDDYYA